MSTMQVIGPLAKKSTHESQKISPGGIIGYGFFAVAQISKGF